ncbi:hypothetical protein N7512_003765, partial [Penicillium capsulatum]
MDEHPAHWSSTLMGWEFWKDATDYEEQLNKTLEVALDLNLHKRFPFNLIPEQTSRPPDVPPTPKKRRRLSVSDISCSGLRRHGSITFPPSRFLDVGRGTRSPSPMKHSAPSTPVMPWSPPLVPCKTSDESKEIPKVETIEVSPSPILAPIIHFPAHRPEIAMPHTPLMNIRRFSWENLSTEWTILGLDLFKPCHPDREEVDYLNIMEIKPLCQFRRLRSLKIVGMLQSYQTYIWQAVWLNMNLDELELGMAMEPVVANQTFSMEWQPIQHGWAMNSKHFAKPVYYGYRGEGELHHNIGYGEYLDKQSMETAKIRALAMGPTRQRLSIKKLTLSGFVVDADPFVQWFDPEKFRSIHLKGQCIDAGLWLPQSMTKVSVRVPRPIDLDAVPVGILKLDLHRDIKVVTLKRGRVMKTSPFRGWENLAPH